MGCTHRGLFVVCLLVDSYTGAYRVVCRCRGCCTGLILHETPELNAFLGEP